MTIILYLNKNDENVCSNWAIMNLFFCFDRFSAHCQPRRGWTRPLPGSLVRKLAFSSHASLLSKGSTKSPSSLLYSPTLLDLVYLFSLFHFAYCLCRAVFHYFRFQDWHWNDFNGEEWALNWRMVKLFPLSYFPWFHSALNNYFLLPPFLWFWIDIARSICWFFSLFFF